MRLPGRRSGVALAALVFAVGALAAQAPPVAGRSPGPRLGHASAFQERDRTLILFGGFRPDGRPLADTWAWDGSSWRELPVRGPSARRWPAMAYDAAHSRVVLHGGRSGVGREGEPLDDTWEWDGARWKLLALAGPGGRDHHRLVYDAERVGIVLFGGWDGEATRGDTWELVGSEWRRLDIEGPAPRAAHGLAYDQRQRQVVLFGGSSDTTFFGDTWRLRGGRWTLVDVPGPGARSFHGMAFDGERGVVVLVGGRAVCTSTATRGRSTACGGGSGPATRCRRATCTT